MDRFLNVGIGKYSDNFIALRVAQDLTNEKAEIFKLVYENCVFEGLIVSVHARNNYFKIQMSDGSKTDRLDIEKLESIEKVSRWNFDFNINKSFKIYVDDIRSVPEGYIGTKSVYETISFIEYIEENGGTIEILDLDHDLGDFAWLGGDAIKLLDYLVMEEKFYPIKFHTANPVGRANMERMVERYWS